MAKIKVLLIEDNRLLREGTTALLNEQPDIRAVASQGNRTALEKAKKLRPDVVLLDLGLKSYNSLKVLDLIKAQHPNTEVVVMDLLPNQSDLVVFAEAGVAGYVPKDATIEDFLHTIRSVAKGVKVVPPTISASIFSKIVENAVQGGAVDRVREAVKLTKPEQDVVGLLANGSSILETSRRLKIAPFTVKGHVHNILDKLALHSRLDLTAFAQSKSKGKVPAVRVKKSRA
ncbi:MAG: response regulator transcription factor [Candidatus Zixiibacteriota bacterium]